MAFLLLVLAGKKSYWLVLLGGDKNRGELNSHVISFPSLIYFKVAFDYVLDMLHS